jgi:hypothetical protein
LTRRRTATVVVGGVLAAAFISFGASAAAAATAKPVDLKNVEVLPIPAGNGVAQASATAATARSPLPAGYEEQEHLVRGTASLYDGPARGPAKIESTDHPFTTRVLVRAPSDPSAFSGTVWVEPFNTSGGGEADALWGSLAPLAEQRGDAWVGVTVRNGSVARLQEFDGARYADLDLAATGYGWDVLRDVGTLLKTNSSKSPLADLDVKHVYLGGYSQSGVDVGTFASSFHDVTRLKGDKPTYDGYLVGARGGNLSPLQSSGALIPAFQTAALRNLDVPTIDLEPQANAEGFAVEVPTVIAQDAGLAGADKITTPTFTYTSAGGVVVRKPDTNAPDNRYRLYEVAGAPHGNGGGTAACPGISSFPVRYFTRAAEANLARWAEKGIPPAPAPRLTLATKDDVSVARTDQYGNAVGGLRSPFVDVALSRYEAHQPGSSCTGFGNEVPLSKDVLTQRYGDATKYMQQFTKSLDKAIKAGTLLSLDRQAILDAQQVRANELFAPQ